MVTSSLRNFGILIIGSENRVRGTCRFKTQQGGFPGGAVVESLPANAGDTGSSPGLGRSHMQHGAAKQTNKQTNKKAHLQDHIHIGFLIAVCLI